MLRLWGCCYGPIHPSGDGWRHAYCRAIGTEEQEVREITEHFLEKARGGREAYLRVFEVVSQNEFETGEVLWGSYVRLHIGPNAGDLKPYDVPGAKAGDA